MYIECAKRVTEKRTVESHKDTTCILNELLADENWLNQVSFSTKPTKTVCVIAFLLQLFFEVRSVWAEVDSLEHGFSLKQKTKVKWMNF